MSTKGQAGPGPHQWSPPLPGAPEAHPVAVEDEDAVDGAEESWGEQQGTQSDLGAGL